MATPKKKPAVRMKVATAAPEPRTNLKGHYVRLLTPDGDYRAKLTRVWWRGNRPSRVCAGGEILRVQGVVLPGEMFRNRTWILRVVPPALKIVPAFKNHHKRAA